MLDSFKFSVNPSRQVSFRLFISGPFELVKIEEVEKFFEAETNQLEFDPPLEGQIQMEIKPPTKNFLKKGEPQRNRKDDDAFSNRQFLTGNFSLHCHENQILVEHFNRLIFTLFMLPGIKYTMNPFNQYE